MWFAAGERVERVRVRRMLGCCVCIVQVWVWVHGHVRILKSCTSLSCRSTSIKSAAIEGHAMQITAIPRKWKNLNAKLNVQARLKRITKRLHIFRNRKITVHVLCLMYRPWTNSNTWMEIIVDWQHTSLNYFSLHLNKHFTSIHTHTHSYISKRHSTQQLIS